MHTATTATDSEPKLLDRRYTIGRAIAEGGLGAVYEGRHLHTGNRVAIKLLRRDRSQDSRSRARLRRAR